MGQQTSFLSKDVPDLSKPKLVPKGKGLEAILTDVARVTKSFSTFDFEDRNVPNMLCTGVKMRYELIVPDRTEAQMDDILNMIRNSQDGIAIDCCAKKFITGALWTQEPTCEICVPLCCDMNTCCKPVQVDFLQKITSLMRTLRTLERKIIEEPREKGCFCQVKQLAPMEFTLFFMKMTILVEIEHLLLMSAVGTVDQHGIPTGITSIEEINKYLVQCDANHRFLRDKISNALVEIGGFKSERVFIPESNDFTSQYDVSRFNSDLNGNLLKNYSQLSGGIVSYYPKHMKKIMDKFYATLNVVDSKARIKTVKSMGKHPVGKVFDLFGFQLFVNEASLFRCFSKAALVAKFISTEENVAGVAISHKLRSEKNATDGMTRCWVDFNMAISFKIPGTPICEIQVVPVQTFIVDNSLGGHDNYDAEQARAGEGVLNAILSGQQAVNMTSMQR
jgi:hypothetical protein